MSDEGKVLIGTDGNPLLSADGKVVLADALYKMRATASTPAQYYKLVAYDAVTPPCAINDVWDASWEQPEGYVSTLIAGAGVGYKGTPAVRNSAIQVLERYSFSNANVNFDRVASLTVRVRVAAILLNPSLYDGKGDGYVYAGVGVAAPSGSEIPWEDGNEIAEGWSLIAELNFVGQTENEVVTYYNVSVPVVSGVPKTLSLVGAFSPFGCGDNVFQDIEATITQVSVVYNLAT